MRRFAYAVPPSVSHRTCAGDGGVKSELVSGRQRRSTAACARLPDPRRGVL
jgi:hypothetical protein